MLRRLPARAFQAHSVAAAAMISLCELIRTCLAGAVAVAVLAGCSAGEAGNPFLAPEGYSRSGLAVTPGTTAVIGLGSLQLMEVGDRAIIRSLKVEGDRVDDPAGRVLGVKVYRLDASGGIGAITMAELSGVDGNSGWTLQPPEGVALPAEGPLGVVVVVRGDSLGTWSSNSLAIDYTLDGRHRTQHVPIGALVCVVVDLDSGCPD